MATSIQLSPNFSQPNSAKYRPATYERSSARYRPETPQHYNIKVSNLQLSFTGTFDVEWDDNVNRSASDEESDISLAPGLQLGVYWPLNPSFTISSGLSMRYQYYTGDEGDDGFEISGTQGGISADVMADLKLGQDGLLTLSDAFSRNIESIEVRARQPNSSDYELNTNVIALRYSNQFTNYLSGAAKLTHTNQWTSDSAYDSHDLYSDFIDVALLHQLNRSFHVGPYAKAGIYRYSEDKHNDSDELGAGVAFVYQRSAAFGINGSVGWQDVSFDNDNTPGADDDAGNLTYKLGAVYSNSEFTTHSLGVNYGASQGTLDRNVNYAKQLGVNYGLAWEIHKNIILKGSLGYVNTRESDGGDNSDFYSAGIGTGYQLTQQTSISLNYLHEWKTSGASDAQYTQNRVQLSLRHQF